MSILPLIQVSFFPLRTSLSMPMKATHEGVSGLLMRMVSPSEKPPASLTEKEEDPAETYASEIVVEGPARVKEAYPLTEMHRCGLPVIRMTVPLFPSPDPRRTTPPVVIRSVPEQA